MFCSSGASVEPTLATEEATGFTPDAVSEGGGSQGNLIYLKLYLIL
jgi:hypothetical protein